MSNREQPPPADFASGPAASRALPTAERLAIGLFALAATVFLCWLAFGHAWFRDEAQVLLIAQASTTPADLVRWLGYEGTTGLFHFLVWGLCRIGAGTPWATTALYSAWIAGYVALIAFALRVPVAARIALFLLPCTLYYADNVRQYLLGSVLLLAVAAIFARRGAGRPGPALAVLALTVQVSLHYAAVAGLLAGVLAARGFREWRGRDFAAAALMCLSMALALLQILPPADLMPGLRDWDSGDRSFSRTFAAVAWSALFGGHGMPLILLALLLYLVWHTRLRWPAGALAALGALVFGLGTFSAVAYWKYSDDRHHWALGFMVVALIALLARETGVPDIRARRAFSALAWIAAALLLPGFATESARLLNREKSASRAAALILDREFSGRPVVGAVEFLVAPIVVYRERPEPFFALDRGTWAVQTVWNHPSVDYRGDPEVGHLRMSRVLERLDELPPALAEASPVLVLGGYTVADDAPDRVDGSGYRSRRWLLTRRASLQGHEIENYEIFDLTRAD